MAFDAMIGNLTEAGFDADENVGVFSWTRRKTRLEDGSRGLLIEEITGRRSIDLDRDFSRIPKVGHSAIARSLEFAPIRFCTLVGIRMLMNSEL